MKKYLLAIIFFVPFFVTTNVYSNDFPDFPFVFTEGKGKLEVPPDIATVSFKVQAFDSDSSKALQDVYNRCADLINYFSDQKIEKEEIVSYEIDKRAIRETKEFVQLKITGYEVSRRFTVTLRNIGLYEQFIKKIVSMENLVDFSTKFDRTDRKEIEARLLTEASQNAREQAELMAKGFDAQLGPIFAVSQQGFSHLAPKFDLRGVSEGRTSTVTEKEILFVPSTITLQNTVSAIFKLK